MDLVSSAGVPAPLLPLPDLVALPPVPPPAPPERLEMTLAARELLDPEPDHALLFAVL